MFDNPDEALNYLKKKAAELELTNLANVVLMDERFSIWSGSSKPHQHHYGKGQLAIHTAEVVLLCFANANVLNLLDEIGPQKIYLSALFHDSGKMWDYAPKDAEYQEWEGTRHKRLIHHISRSALLFQENSKILPTEIVDDILHAILAHHGLREWGSPVCPKSKLAWLLHLCDGISARMNDADKWDHV